MTETATQTQELQIQSSFMSCSDFRLHFGLADAKRAEVRVRWPSGEWQDLGSVTTSQLITVREGRGVVPNFGWK